MEFRDSPEQARFRQTIRSWLAENVPAFQDTKPETAEQRVAFARRWQRQLFDGGWAGLEWPKAYGGREVGPIESVIWGEEYARAGAPDLIQLSVGTALVGPTLIAHGSDHQKQRFLEPILRGDEIWCQGFSEPGAGSDLAALRTLGEVQEDAVVVTGQKIWTSFAQHAEWCLLVVRTNADAPKHRRLSLLLLDMSLPGITIRPLREMTGEAWFNEVFLDAVHVPREYVVGEIDSGWDVIMTTLAHERGSSAAHARLGVEVERLIALAKQTGAANDPRLRQKLAQFASEVAILRASAYRNATVWERTGQPGPEGSTLKLLWSQLDQRVKETAVEVLGPGALLSADDPAAVDAGYWCHELLWSRAATIYAGTSEVQRNIIASRVLRMPKR